jgi:hypothetical protein
MSRPWTAIATSNINGIRKNIVFDGDFDATKAAEDFDKKFNGMQLEALIPGVHTSVYIRGGNDKIVPRDKLFSGF